MPPDFKRYFGPTVLIEFKEEDSSEEKKLLYSCVVHALFLIDIFLDLPHLSPFITDQRRSYPKQKEVTPTDSEHDDFSPLTILEIFNKIQLIRERLLALNIESKDKNETPNQTKERRVEMYLHYQFPFIQTKPDLITLDSDLYEKISTLLMVNEVTQHSVWDFSYLRKEAARVDEVKNINIDPRILMALLIMGNGTSK